MRPSSKFASLLRLPLASLTFALSLTLSSCSSRGDGDSGPTAEDMAAAAAKQCYEALYGNRPDEFLNGKAEAATLPMSYRKQLTDDYRRHQAKVEATKQGVRSVSVSRAVKDESLGIVQVFLMLNFGDGTREEVVVPMVEYNGEWKIK